MPRGQHLARRIDHGVDVARVVDCARRVHVEGGAGIVLAAHARRPRRLHDLRDEGVDRTVELGRGMHLADDAGLARPQRRDDRRRPDEIGEGLARHAIDQRRHHHGRHDVVRHLRHLEFGAVGRERDVADRRDGAAEAVGAALDHADHRDVAAPERAVAVEHDVVAPAQLVCLERRPGRPLAHGFAADAEIVARPAQHHDLGALAGAEQELGQLDRHGVGRRIADLRAVERDLEHRSLAGGENVVGHASSPWVRMTCLIPKSAGASTALSRCPRVWSFPSPFLRCYDAR